ncbi:class I SAM-dependent methyltransferase [Edwardsiella hoshinae]|uniref:Predicted methyltransferase (Contains TPR repeat) n=1 Tax=Edwardsiella hoshinae TaxID=93378 RepID=A0A376DBR8_9GAMM|nr:class I SAM-dependent methyltransferase [Edwardsiella hoshinae]QPR27942.1 class I SAM-dependent methyltransferase [Edwardsiella hoshinae]STC85491.1 Predicted methyltransferase (contains TPR repeat) [Edwardsiella hoshinae]
MLIDDIDFAALYRQQLTLAQRTPKSPEHWDRRAQAMSVTCAAANDPYLQQLTAAIDLRQAQTLLDVGCGPGSVCLALAPRLRQVYGLDYSPGMLAVAAQRAAQQGIDNAILLRRAWEEPWDDIPRCDIAVASRSTLVDDLRPALAKLNRHARLGVYTTHPVSSSFVDGEILRAIGRPVRELPNYLYAVNILYQMGIYAEVNFIRVPACQQRAESAAQFADALSVALGEVSAEERQALEAYYRHCRLHGRTPAGALRDWALISWRPQPLAEESA